MRGKRRENSSSRRRMIGVGRRIGRSPLISMEASTNASAALNSQRRNRTGRRGSGSGREEDEVRETISISVVSLLVQMSFNWGECSLQHRLNNRLGLDLHHAGVCSERAVLRSMNVARTALQFVETEDDA